MNNTQADKHIDVVIPIYNLIQYNTIYNDIYIFLQ